MITKTIITVICLWYLFKTTKDWYCKLDPDSCAKALASVLLLFVFVMAVGCSVGILINFACTFK